MINYSIMISTLMSVYNGHKHLDETIESILNQTYEDFEFIIIDDGSTDGAIDIILFYQNRDGRIKVIRNENNIGLALSLNKGIKQANGKYIARMDADDISLPKRFITQIEFLENNPNIWILGCNIFHIDNKGNKIREITYPTDPNRLRWNMLFGTTGLVCHPCAMMRTEKIINSGYYKNTKASQDMELWSRFFLFNPLPIHNLQIPLVNCRWHEGSFSVKYSSLQHQASSKIRLNTINHTFNRNYSLEMVEAYRDMAQLKNRYTKQNIKKYMASWLEVLSDFQSKFEISPAQLNHFYNEILYKMRNYASLNPFVSLERHRVWVPELLPALGFKNCINLAKYKLNRLIKDSN